jgi:hypothetical protein
MFHPRWKASVYYRMDAGIIDIVHDLEEIGDLHELIEGGPHWDTIDRIEIVRVNHCTAQDLTVEAATKI